MIESNTSWDLINVMKWCTLKSLFTHCPIVEMKGPTSWKFKAEERKGLEVQFKVRFDYNLLHNQFIHFSSYSCFVYDAFFYFSSWFLLLRCKTSKCKPKKNQHDWQNNISFWCLKWVGMVNKAPFLCPRFCFCPCPFCCFCLYLCLSLSLSLLPE